MVSSTILGKAGKHNETFHAVLCFGTPVLDNWLCPRRANAARTAPTNRDPHRLSRNLDACSHAHAAATDANANA